MCLPSTFLSKILFFKQGLIIWFFLSHQWTNSLTHLKFSSHFWHLNFSIWVSLFVPCNKIYWFQFRSSQYIWCILHSNKSHFITDVDLQFFTISEKVKINRCDRTHFLQCEHVSPWNEALGWAVSWARSP